MNRRDFLKALTTVGAGALVAESLATDIANDGDYYSIPWPTTVRHYLLGSQSFEQIIGLKFYGIEEKTRPAEYVIKRVKSDTPLFRWMLNPNGQFVEWKANPYRDDGIVMVKGAEIEIIADFDGASTILARRLLDEQMTNVVYHFAHRRRLATVGYEQLTENNFRRIGREV